jgi:hypothetical protein
MEMGGKGPRSQGAEEPRRIHLCIHAPPYPFCAEVRRGWGAGALSEQSDTLSDVLIPSKG